MLLTIVINPFLSTLSRLNYSCSKLHFIRITENYRYLVYCIKLFIISLQRPVSNYDQTLFHFYRYNNTKSLTFSSSRSICSALCTMGPLTAYWMFRRFWLTLSLVRHLSIFMVESLESRCEWGSWALRRASCCTVVFKHYNTAPHEYWLPIKVLAHYDTIYSFIFWIPVYIYNLIKYIKVL